ncbi:MAG TPA: SOS response-associated peptidase [Gammaproteobacteria bacterium]|nr:SOS response-associated peptidase [Gammaproteobacteria bacterium]
MCGRFALFATPEQLVEYFELFERPSLGLEPHFNITPGQAVAAVRVGRDGRRRLDVLQWGLVPFWAKDRRIGYKLINARLESLADKPAFREALSRRRCLIAASGFYEWADAGEGAKRRPHFVRTTDDTLLAFAGLWERWRGADGAPLETCTIVTTAANAALAPIHDRMPLAVARADLATWLDPATSLDELSALAARGPSLEAWPVGTAVNDPRNDDERLIEPAAGVGS